MGNELKSFNNLLGISKNSEQNTQIENSNTLNNNDVNDLNEDEIFLIKGFKHHYILTLANMINKNIILLGDSKIGKTKIFNIIFEKENLNDNNENNNDKSNNNNNSNQNQNYAYFEEKNFIIDGLEVNINIWDTPGEESHKEANKHFIKDCIINYLCFHVNSPKSFENIKNYYIKIVKEINGDNTFIVLVGIKNEIFDDNDNKDYIPTNMIKKFAENYNILFYSVSLNDSNSIKYLFHDSIKKYALFQSKLTFQKK